MKITVRNVTLGMLLACTMAFSANASAEDFDPNGDWRFGVYLWALGLEGELGIGPIQEDIDLSFSDLLSALDIGGAALVRYDRGANAFIGDFQYYSLEPDAVSTPTGGSISTNLKMTIFNGFYGRKFQVNDGYVMGMAGFRYVNLDLTLTRQSGFEPIPDGRRSDDPSFTDGVLGMMVVQPMSDKWDVVFQVDVGAGGSNSSWNSMIQFQRVTKSDNRWSLGARIMGVDFDDTLPNGEVFTMDTTMIGATVGFIWD